MERITQQQSKNFVPLKDDFSNSEPQFFSLTPSKDEDYPFSEGWEDVTYFTGRKVDLYSNREGDGDSWVYVLSNESIPGLLKIGSTQKSPEERAKQISRGTGIPTEFNVEFAFKCFNAERLEREIHRYFKAMRISKDREFFQVPLSEAKKAIENIGKKYL